ncbi:MAG TPA: uracil-DNA glycosylase [Cryomorphaceae bacterium]|nr:uracil-DNA glycosylase [Cryomorphaceae bacterium]
MLLPPLPSAWKFAIESAMGASGWHALLGQMESAYASSTVFPPAEQVWAALETLRPEDVRVVILGQDPYHGAGQAHGYAFSVPPGCAIPPSLRNIFTEYMHDTGYALPRSGDLRPWARQGVLLWNTALTVAEGQPGSHSRWGYGELTAGLLSHLSTTGGPKAFWLWGKHAQKAGRSIHGEGHLLIESAHPSPLGAYRGFWGSKPFGQTNDFFQAQGLPPVNWCLDDVPLKV